MWDFLAEEARPPPTDSSMTAAHTAADVAHELAVRNSDVRCQPWVLVPTSSDRRPLWQPCHGATVLPAPEAAGSGADRAPDQNPADNAAG